MRKYIKKWKYFKFIVKLEKIIKCLTFYNLSVKIWLGGFYGERNFKGFDKMEGI